MSKILIDEYEVPVEYMSPDMSRIPESKIIPSEIAQWMHENGMCGNPLEEVIQAYNASIQ